LHGVWTGEGHILLLLKKIEIAVCMFFQYGLERSLAGSDAHGEHARLILADAGFYAGGYIQTDQKIPILSGIPDKAADSRDRTSGLYRLCGRRRIFQEAV